MLSKITIILVSMTSSGSRIRSVSAFVELTFSCHGLHYMNEYTHAKYIITCAAYGMGGEHYCVRAHVRTPCVSLGRQRNLLERSSSRHAKIDRRHVHGFFLRMRMAGNSGGVKVEPRWKFK